MKSYKSYKEMTRCVLEARDEHLKKKRRQRLIIMRCVPALSTFCIALIIGFGFWKNIPQMPEIETIPPITEATTEAITTTENGMTAVETNSAQQTTEQTSAQIITTSAPQTVTASISTTANATTVTEKPSVPSPVTESTSDTPSEQPTTLDGDQSGCPDNHVYLHWDEMTINQQYFFAELGKPTLSYSTAEKEVPANEVGEYISKAYMSGYDWYEQIYYHCEANAYKLKGDDEAKIIAIKFEDDENYYLYTLNEPNYDDEPSG